MESPLFGSGSDQVELHLGADGNGTIRFGDASAPPLPPVTDPNVVYLPNDHSFLNLPDLSYVYEGVLYSIQNVSLTKLRLRFTVDNTEVWSPWCKLQTPYVGSLDPNSYYCLPNEITFGVDSECFYSESKAQVDCAKFGFCVEERGCSCDANGCTKAPSRVSSDMVHNGDRLDGSIPAGNGAGGVHLERIH